MLEAGIRGRRELTVTDGNTAESIGSGELPVFATPAMAALMEETAWRSVAPFLEEGEGTVGISLALQHVSATPVGMKVVCESTLTAVEGRKLTFHLTASDEAGLIGEADHERFLIRNGRFLARAEEKNGAPGKTGERFNEKTQAFLAMCWGRELLSRFGGRGREAFIYAVRCYGEGRGRRMAQRAIRDGEPLTLGTYLRYKEWTNTEEVRAMGDANRASVLANGDCYIKEVTRCPWQLQFAAMGEDELGALYCRFIDRSIAEGFSPDIDYRVPQNLNQGVNCLHVVEHAGLSGEKTAIRSEYLRPFDFHCADLHQAFRRAVCAIFPEEGAEAAASVEAAFRAEYGQDMADYLVRLSFTGSFNA